jgi:hypothetical protein
VPAGTVDQGGVAAPGRDHTPHEVLNAVAMQLANRVRRHPPRRPPDAFPIEVVEDAHECDAAEANGCQREDSASCAHLSIVSADVATSIDAAPTRRVTVSPAFRRISHLLPSRVFVIRAERHAGCHALTG